MKSPGSYKREPRATRELRTETGGVGIERGEEKEGRKEGRELKMLLLTEGPRAKERRSSLEARKGKHTLPFQSPDTQPLLTLAFRTSDLQASKRTSCGAVSH